MRNGRHRRGGHRGEHARPAPAETRLERLPQVLRDAVHLDLRVAVMRHAHDPARIAGLLERAEHGVEERIVVLRQVDPVGILIEEFPVIGERVLLHREPALHRGQDRIDIDLPLHRVPDASRIRGEPQALAAHAHPFRREHGPRRAQQQEHPEDEQ